VRSLFSQNEKFGLRGFFTSPIFFIHEDEFFSHKRRNLDLGVSSQVQFFIHEMEGGAGGGSERKKGGELDAAVVIKYNPFMLSLSWIQFLLILHDPRVL
jgi:hypothetical protein